MLGEKVTLRECGHCDYGLVWAPVSSADSKIGHMCKDCKKEKLDRYFERR